jgi:hypothetical protein
MYRRKGRARTRVDGDSASIVKVDFTSIDVQIISDDYGYEEVNNMFHSAWELEDHTTVTGPSNELAWVIII